MATGQRAAPKPNGHSGDNSRSTKKIICLNRHGPNGPCLLGQLKGTRSKTALSQNGNCSPRPNTCRYGLHRGVAAARGRGGVPARARVFDRTASRKLPASSNAVFHRRAELPPARRSNAGRIPKISARPTAAPSSPPARRSGAGRAPKIPAQPTAAPGSPLRSVPAPGVPQISQPGLVPESTGNFAPLRLAILTLRARAL